MLLNDRMSSKSLPIYNFLSSPCLTYFAFLFFFFECLQVIARVIVDYSNKVQKNHALLNRVRGATSEAEQEKLVEISSKMFITATVLPIRSVGVQGMTSLKI